ncbi:nicotinamidase/pyrazinamidase [Vibrio cholerae]|nr:isochorismatase family protein [Vibrio cholerae]GHZ32101.1 nicotinamidase/pyrazinamidase [Vibrio cholerae]GHZ98900.1 nicotinamidase/pyrazinamidase [Vibrio cholerae]GIA76670.1 nicotinamidase/pyrazinamidase [Vibrio cholerae]GIB71351.1 nicotinamidase/pyrazinamidase [Vibrio cholerae]
MNSSALIIIDIQNDYFPNGLYPQWQAEQVLDNTLQAVDIAQRHQMPIILVQHIADPKLGSAPFFNANTRGQSCILN